MDLSTFALLLAVIELLIGLPMLVAPSSTATWLTRLMKDDVQYRLVGAVLLAICVLPLVDSQAITFDVAGIVRLVALLGAIKCLVICWWPSRQSRMAEAVIATSAGRTFMGVAATAAGVLLLLAACHLR